MDLLFQETQKAFGRGDRIATPSSHFPGGTPFLKMLRQTCSFAGPSSLTPIRQKLGCTKAFGRGDRIRTCDPLVPNQMR